MRIPGIGAEDIAVLPGILSNFGIFVRVEAGFGEYPGAVLIREIDLPRVKEALASYRLRTSAGREVPIPW
jgi:hypothetical protein